jgi:hypothetical protein
VADKHCPLYKEACHEHTCRWYIQLMGSHPQTGVALTEWGCAVEWLPILMIEQSKEVRQSAAAIESFRNESVNNAQQIAAALVFKGLPEKVIE